MPGLFSSACDSSEEVRVPSRDWSETFRKHEPSSLCVSIIDNVLQLSCYMSGQISKPVEAQSDLCLFCTRTQWPVVVFKNHSATAPLIFRPNNGGPKGPKKFETAPPYLRVCIPPPLSKGLDPSLLTYLWKLFMLTGQFAVEKNPRRG